MNDIEHSDDNDVIAIEHENSPSANPSTSGTGNERDNVERQETTSVPEASSSPTVKRDVNAVLAARVLSLETRLIAMDNLQTLLRSKSAQLVECSARLRESESARRAAEHLVGITIRRRLQVNRGGGRVDGSASGTPATRTAEFVRFQVPSTAIAAAVGSDSSSSDEGSAAKDNDGFGSCIDVCDDCELWTPSRKSVAAVGGSVDETPEAPTVGVSAGDVAAAMRGKPHHDQLLSFGVVGGETRPSMDLIAKLMRQNARLKETIRQMIERRHRMTMTEYLDWLEQDDIRQQHLHQQTRWRHAEKPKLLVNSQKASRSRDNDPLNTDSDREKSGNSISQPLQSQRTCDTDIVSVEPPIDQLCQL